MNIELNIKKGRAGPKKIGDTYIHKLHLSFSMSAIQSIWKMWIEMDIWMWKREMYCQFWFANFGHLAFPCRIKETI